MNERRVECIVLKTIPFKESDRILSLFTPDRGVMSLFVRGLSKSRPSIVNLTTPLCRGEFIFRKGRSDLHRFIDGTIMDMHLKLRRSYSHLECAGKMLNAISTSQMAGKAAPGLYALLASYLSHLSDFSECAAPWASFQLKLLLHEGLLALDGADSEISSFSGEDWKTLLLLSHARRFDILKNLEVTPPFAEAVERLYQSRLDS